MSKDVRDMRPVRMLSTYEMTHLYACLSFHRIALVRPNIQLNYIVNWSTEIEPMIGHIQFSIIAYIWAFQYNYYVVITNRAAEMPMRENRFGRS